jgi:hypothetical protein
MASSKRLPCQRDRLDQGEGLHAWFEGQTGSRVFGDLGQQARVAGPERQTHDVRRDAADVLDRHGQNILNGDVLRNDKSERHVAGSDPERNRRSDRPVDERQSDGPRRLQDGGSESG